MANISFADAIEVKRLDSHAYGIDLKDSFTIGAVPNGGYTASCMLAAANMHLSSDTLTAHFEYPRATAPGPAIVIIEEVKLGRQLSRLHLTLWQGGLLSKAPWITPSVSRRIILAYTIHTNLSAFEGISLPTGYEETSTAALPPLPDFDRLKNENGDGKWERLKLPKSVAHLRSLSKWAFYLPRGGQLEPGVMDMWMRLASGERITQSALPYVVDSFPHNLHTFLASTETRKMLESMPLDPAAAETPGKKSQPSTRTWLPTLFMNLEVKMALPEEGVEWLAMRVTSKQIRDGRFDLDVVVRDLGGEVVALSHQVAMIVVVESKSGKVKL